MSSPSIIHFFNTNEQGELEIKGLPVGDEIVFRAWHERGSFKQQIFVEGEETKWKNNNFEVKIKPGLNDLGVVEIPLDQF